ncbi:MAG: tetratricopeptide repeat protein [Planctomycetales bacterium]|nr:tetratricopeptide repeat protein [Planctomycetales bacterium]
MRSHYLWILAVATAAWAVPVAGPSAADDARQSDKAIQSSGEIRVLDPTAADAKDEDGADATSPKHKVGVPTPAKREPGAKRAPADPAASELPPTPATKPTTEQPKTEVEPLSPIPDPMEAPPVSVETASFKGITPGVSTKDDVEKSWGRPRDTSRANGFLVQLYSVEPFKQVEVSYAGEKASSIVIRLGHSFPADAVAKQLDLAAIRPVLVSNELGEILGLAYPERGVLFAFEQSDEPGKPSMKVLQIILETVSAESFVLRAETTMESRYDLSRRDLEQALKLEPNNARAHWLLGRVLAATERHEEALAETGKAVRLEPDNPQYRATHAQVLAQAGLLLDAVQHTQRAIETSADRPHIKARATCLLGDLLASGSKPDFKKALTYHTEAIRIADQLCSSPHPAIRVAAKEVLIDAHLGAAHDIAWGEYKEKGKAVVRWLERARAAADDVVENERGNPLLLFHVCTRTLSAYVGVRGKIDPASAVKATVEVGEKLIAATRDPGRKAQLQWELGTALYDAVQVCQMRSENEKALKYGRTAAEYLADSNRANPSPATALLLGRLYFRLGAIHALGDRDHKAAVVWFDKALPLLKGQPAEELADNLGRHGEAMVSMGVSYWQTGQREKAVELTEQGIRWMEQAVRQESLDRSTLAVPYGNLAAMHRKLGDGKKADRLLELAGRIKEEKLK